MGFTVVFLHRTSRASFIAFLVAWYTKPTISATSQAFLQFVFLGRLNLKVMINSTSNGADSTFILIN